MSEALLTHSGTVITAVASGVDAPRPAGIATSLRPTLGIPVLWRIQDSDFGSEILPVFFFFSRERCFFFVAVWVFIVLYYRNGLDSHGGETCSCLLDYCVPTYLRFELVERESGANHFAPERRGKLRYSHHSLQVPPDTQWFFAALQKSTQHSANKGLMFVQQECSIVQQENFQA